MWDNVWPDTERKQVLNLNFWCRCDRLLLIPAHHLSTFRVPLVTFRCRVHFGIVSRHIQLPLLASHVSMTQKVYTHKTQYTKWPLTTGFKRDTNSSFSRWFNTQQLFCLHWVKAETSCDRNTIARYTMNMLAYQLMSPDSTWSRLRAALTFISIDIQRSVCLSLL